MRWSVSIGTMLAAGVIAVRPTTSAATSGPRIATGRQPRTAGRPSISNSSSRSMFPIRWIWTSLPIQREGYAQAIVSQEFLQALKNGPNSKIAVTYFEWSASSDQKIIIPWRVIDGPETADAVASRNPEKRRSAGVRAPQSPAPSISRCRCSTRIPYRGLQARHRHFRRRAEQ